jgi:hypothetical protein
MMGVNNLVQAAGVATSPAISSDFSWSAAGAWAAFLAVLAVIIRQVGPWRQIFNDSEAKFRSDLITRLEAVEQTLEQERTERAIEQRRHEAERALDRHRLNNVTQCFDALLLMLKRAPEKVAEIIQDIEEMRARQLHAEAVEKATIHAVGIEAEIKPDG